MMEYPEGETPTTAPIDQPDFDPDSETWANYWDHNPIEHGGKFVRWERDMWKIVEVNPPSAVPGTEAHFLDVHWVEPADVWEDPEDPLTGFAEPMKRVLDSLGEAEQHYPNGDGNPLFGNLEYYVADIPHYIGVTGGNEMFDISDAENREAAYWSALEGYGVDAADVEGVAESDLPE